MHTPDFYNIKIKTIDSDFTININKLATDFPYAKTYPTNLTYSTKMNFNKAAVNKTSGDIFILKDNIKTDIESVDKTIKQTIKQISKLDTDNMKLIKTLQQLENERQSAIGMFDDSKERYNFKLLENWLMFVSICGICYKIYKMTPNK